MAGIPPGLSAYRLCLPASINRTSATLLPGRPKGQTSWNSGFSGRKGLLRLIFRIAGFVILGSEHNFAVSGVNGDPIARSEFSAKERIGQPILYLVLGHAP